MLKPDVASTPTVPLPRIALDWHLSACPEIVNNNSFRSGMNGVNSTLTNRDRKVAEELKKRLLACDGTRIQRVLLYGSRARGTVTKESDFDLLVIEKDPVSKREEMARLRQAVQDQQNLVDIWVMGEAEFEETKDIIGGLAYPAHKYGLVLYEKT
jgi:predicted nucleotidyltransferase